MQNRIQEKIEDVLNEKVRPSLRKHHGDVAVLNFEEGILKIQLLGQCSNCPSSYLTTEQLIEKELVGAIPEVNQVLLVTPVSDELLDMARSILCR